MHLYEKEREIKNMAKQKSELDKNLCPQNGVCRRASHVCLCRRKRAIVAGKVCLRPKEKINEATNAKKESEKVEVQDLRPKSVFSYGGVNWVVLQHTKLGNHVASVLCIAEKVLFNKSFDAGFGNNDWRDSSLRRYLNCSFLEKLISNGAEKKDFSLAVTNLTADDGLTDYGCCVDAISLISCRQYREYRGIIPNADDWWWTCTPVRRNT